jgi:putative DNA primase/helicase
VLVVEGEKTAAAAGKLFKDHVVVTWVGGVKAISKSDWTPVNGRKLVIWPDADAPGRNAGNYLKARFPEARLVSTTSLPDKWDLADEPPEGVEVRGLLDGAVVEVPKPPEQPEPFRVLGMREDDIYFHSLATGSIFHFTPPGLTELNLQLLADDDYWMSKGYTKDGEGVDYREVAKSLIKQGRRCGVFDSDCVRGLGCWMDEGRVIYHAGDRLYVDGILTPLHSLKSKFIYISRKPIRFNPDRVLTAEEGQALCDMCDILPWASGTHGWTLPAFLFLSHLCGVLTHRPHGWLVGGYGSGKSYTCSNIIDPLIGPAAAKALSGTTAPGIRQKIGCDAVALFGDEFEGKDPQTRDRLRAITELGRQSYVETGWATLHGTASGDGREYRTRSMFFFSSIAASVLENADLSRFVVLEFQKRDNPEAFSDVKRGVSSTIGQPGFADAFIARSVRFAPLVLKSIDVFRCAVISVCGDSRKADTFGTLAGGKWMLCHDEIPTDEQAKAWAEGIAWENEGAGSARDSDPAKVLETILQHNHRIQDADGKYQDMTIGEMLHTWFDKYTSDSGMRKACYSALLSVGVHPVRVSGENYIDVAKSHPEMSRMFKNTPYGDLYPQHLRRPPLDGVDAQYTPTGCTTKRCVRLKYDPPEPDRP